MRMRTNGVGWVLAAAALAWAGPGCMSSNGSPTIVTDVLWDLPGDPGTADVPVPQDVPSEAGPVDAPPDAPPADLPGDVPTDGTDDPGPVPVDPLLAQHFQSLLDEYLQFSGEYNAALTVQVPGAKRWSGVSGVKVLQTGEAMPEGAAFRVGSSTKPVMAALTLLLVEAGTLGLDDTVGKWVKGYDAWKGITLRQLLGMRSGIQDYLVDQSMWLDILSSPQTPMAPDRLLSYVSQLPLEFEPGSQCLYSNTNYILVGLIIEAATGRPVADQIRDRIVTPLGLAHTYLDMGGANDPLLAHGYMDPRPAFAALGVPPDLVGVIPSDMFVSDHLLDCANLFHPSVAWTAGGLVTTTDDMARFLRAVVRGDLLSQASLDAMMQFPPCTILGQPEDYGLGMTRFTTPAGEGFGHGGLIYGYSANSVDVPAADLTFSHMNGAYPTQFGAFESEVYRLQAQPPTEPAVTCHPPTGFFAGGQPDRLEFRVRGLVNATGAASPSAAVANLSAWNGETRYPLYGTFTSATLKKDAYTTRVEVGSFGPPRAAGMLAGQGLVSIDSSVVQRLNAETETVIDSSQPYAVFSVVMDYWADASTGSANRFCIVAVPDTRQPSRLTACRSGGALVEGEMLKVFGTVPMTWDAAAIDAYLAPLKIATCTCLLAAPDQWGACPQPVSRASSAEPFASVFPDPATAPIRVVAPPAALRLQPRLPPVF